MADITTKDVEYVAGLAQLTLDEVTKERFTGELRSILGYIEKLNELDTSAIEPMMHVLDISNVLREDTVIESFGREVFLANAPETDGEYFIVPKILDTSE